MMAIPGNRPGGGTLLATEEQEIRAGLDAAEQLFRNLAEGTGASVRWLSRIAPPASVLVHEARTADLVVVGRRPERVDASWSRHADPGDVLMRAGRPILVVPPGVSSLNADHVVVAWKDGLEALLRWTGLTTVRWVGRTIKFGFRVRTGRTAEGSFSSGLALAPSSHADERTSAT